MPEQTTPTPAPQPLVRTVHCKRCRNDVQPTTIERVVILEELGKPSKEWKRERQQIPDQCPHCRRPPVL